jgi:hypothetical protein
MAPFELEITPSRPALRADEEPSQPIYARVRLRPTAASPEGTTGRPGLDLSFLLDASASMHRFVLDPQQREYWRQRAEQRGEIRRQSADGRAGTVWTGQTLRELQQYVSTPMLSTLRGVWRTLEALQSGDRISVLGFADKYGVVYEDSGVSEQAVRLEAARTALTRLGSGVDESGLGRGTRLAGGLEHAVARFGTEGAEGTLRRVVLVSDGIIEDLEACRALLDQAVDCGAVISVIGVGDEFDEEFLMMAADLTRGNYYYAATAIEAEQAVRAELEIAMAVAGRQAMLRVQPASGAILNDVYPVAPSLSEFQTVWMEQGTWRFRIGDLSTAQPVEFLMQLAPAAGPRGETPLAAVRVEGVVPSSDASFAIDGAVRVLYTDDPILVRTESDEVMDAVRRLEIYQEERRFAAAEARGDREGATKHLQSATRMLRRLGADELANETESAAQEMQTGTRNLSRTKRVKAGTRKLASR